MDIHCRGKRNMRRCRGKVKRDDVWDEAMRFCDDDDEYPDALHPDHPGHRTAANAADRRRGTAPNSAETQRDLTELERTQPGKIV